MSFLQALLIFITMVKTRLFACPFARFISGKPSTDWQSDHKLRAATVSSLSAPVHVTSILLEARKDFYSD
jgi:hypothetical protein